MPQHVEDRIALGQLGEHMAMEYLRSQGLVILDRNWRPQRQGVRGELDLVARDGNDLVIIEVKTRRCLAYGAPIEAITTRKMRNLRSLALAWLEHRSIHAPQLRFDVISVTIPPAGQPVIEHVKAV
jgi:putative endonuclease